MGEWEDEGMRGQDRSIRGRGTGGAGKERKENTANKRKNDLQRR